MRPTYEVLALRRAGRVQRAHTEPHLGSYSVAEHSGQMLVLLLALHPDPSLNLVRAVMFHDLHEQAIGDIPSPAKRRFGELAAAEELAESTVRRELNIEIRLSPDEEIWLRALDALELLLWAREQWDLGNIDGLRIANRVVLNMEKMTLPARVYEFFQDLPKTRTP